MQFTTHKITSIVHNLMVGMPVKMKIEDGKEGIRGDLNLRLKMGRSVSVEILTYNRRMFDIEYYHFAQILSIYYLFREASRRHRSQFVYYSICAAGITESGSGNVCRRHHRVS